MKTTCSECGSNENSFYFYRGSINIKDRMVMMCNSCGSKDYEIEIDWYFEPLKKINSGCRWDDSIVTAEVQNEATEKALNAIIEIWGIRSRWVSNKDASDALKQCIQDLKNAMTKTKK